MRTTMNVRTVIANQEFAEVSATLDRRVLYPSPETPVRSVVKEWFAPFWWMRISIPLPAAASLAFLILFCSLLISPLLAPSKTSQAISTEDLKNVPTEFRKQLDLYR